MPLSRVLFPIVSVLAALSLQTPAASEPLKVIEHVRASVLCTALHKNVAGAVTGLRIDDDLVNQGRLLLQQLASDSVTNPGSRPSHRMQMDEDHLGELAGVLAKNLATIDTLLADPAVFSAHPASADAAQLARTKTQLAAVAADQKLALNVIAGTAATADLQNLLGGSDGTQGALGKVSQSGTSLAEIGKPVPGSTTAPQVGTAQSTLFSGNAYGELASATLAAERRNGRAEKALTPTVLAIVKECH